ncbi:MAG: nitronate monooxygenase [Magnetococcales bacterium]|nr:nitronate monooxygenase [Magnetococcales bacterium]MBF0148552.1 nitronate monooxygenase [Magnetococcales bacterium]MBF0173777.1 nitronate monooxygenase [Magnetococcales bacterium]MBF0629755.1 nitronate monooxygenase [Magnetococcales bacterium]
MSFPDSSRSSRNAVPESWQRGTRFLGTRYAILGGAMAWLSEHNLVSAISRAGGFGVLASGSMPPELLRQEIQATRRRTTNPFGVNLITMNPQLPELVRVVIDEQVSHCVLAGGLPDQPTIDALKQAGIKVILFAPSLALGKRLIKRGADALIIEGHEAGGHVGPVTTSVLVQEILPHLTEVPVFAAGGIANGTMVAGLVAMGAAGCQLGTRFVVAHECIAHTNFKNAFLRAQSRDAQVTAQFDPVLPVIPVRALVNKGTQNFNSLQLQLIQEVKAGTKDRKTAQLELEHFWVGALKRAAIDGDIEQGSVMAGQSVGLVNSTQSVTDIMTELTSMLS